MERLRGGKALRGSVKLTELDDGQLVMKELASENVWLNVSGVSNEPDQGLEC